MIEPTVGLYELTKVISASSHRDRWKPTQLGYVSYHPTIDLEWVCVVRGDHSFMVTWCDNDGNKRHLVTADASEAVIVAERSLVP